MNRADFVADVYFFPAFFGRRRPTPPDTFDCLAVIDDDTIEVRLHLEGTGAIAPGQTARLPISFLDRGNASQWCSVGKVFVLKETEAIGLGMIEELSDAMSELEKEVS